MTIDRYLKDIVRTDLEDKMVFISGPRQVGKKTFAIDLLPKPKDQYFNWD